MSCSGYELSWVRIVPGTNRLGYELSWVRIVPGTSRLGYELSWVRVVQIPFADSIPWINGFDSNKIRLQELQRISVCLEWLCSLAIALRWYFEGFFYCFSIAWLQIMQNHYSWNMIICIYYSFQNWLNGMYSVWCVYMLFFSFGVCLVYISLSYLVW